MENIAEREIEVLQEIIKENDELIEDLIKENKFLKAHNKTLQNKVREYEARIFERELSEEMS